MLLSIVIINYNTFQLTCDCLRSIQSTCRVNYEIILVDNNSSECPAEKFLEEFADVRLIALKENLGFGRANNLAAEQARGKYLLLLNSDTVVQAGTLDETVGYLESHPEVDILGCKVMFDNNTVQKTVVRNEQEHRLLQALKYLIKRNTFFVETRLFFINRKQKRNGTGEAKNNKKEDKAIGSPEIKINYHNGQRIGSLIGVFLLLKKSVYSASKGFDPDFFMYYEEIEWFVNRLRGYNIVYYPNASVMHYQGASDVHKKMNLQFYVSQHLFWYKMGYAQYAGYFTYILLEIPSRYLARMLYKKTRPADDVPEIMKAIPYFFKILRYSNRYGGRPAMLKLNYLRKNNL